MLRPLVSDRKYLQVTHAIPPHPRISSGSEDNSRSQRRHGDCQVVVEDLIVCLLREYLHLRQQVPADTLEVARLKTPYSVGYWHFVILVRKKPAPLRCRHLQFVDPVPVFPNQGTKKLWCGICLQHRERLTSHAFARKSRRARIASLRDPCPMPITARTVAAKEQLVFVPLEKIGGKRGIAGERIVARVR